MPSLHIYYPGYAEAGVPAMGWNINDLPVLENEQRRQDVKKVFKNAFRVLLGDEVVVTFIDELTE